MAHPGRVVHDPSWTAQALLRHLLMKFLDHSTPFDVLPVPRALPLSEIVHRLLEADHSFGQAILSARDLRNLQSSLISRQRLATQALQMDRVVDADLLTWLLQPWCGLTAWEEA